MTTAQNKALVRRINDELISQGQMSVADELLAEDFVDHDALPGFPSNREGVKQLFTYLRQVFAGLHVTIEDQIAEADRVVTRKTFHGTHQADFLGVAPTGIEVTFGVIDILRIHDGKVTDHWNIVDLFGLMAQLKPSVPPQE
jgi:predicted ester cyclase